MVIHGVDKGKNLLFKYGCFILKLEGHFSTNHQNYSITSGFVPRRIFGHYK